MYNRCKAQDKREMDGRDTSKQYKVEITASETAVEPRSRPRPPESGSLYYCITSILFLCGVFGLDFNLKDIYEWRQA